MLNQSGITSVKGMTKKSIVIDNKLMFATSCMIADTGVLAGGDGKKIVKAGTPLKGDLTNRATALKVATAAEDAVVGIAEFDVDVTNGNANGACIVFGFIDESKLDSDVVEKITTVTKAKLPLITFIK